MNNKKNRSPEELAANLALVQERVVAYHDYIFTEALRYIPNREQALDLTSIVCTRILSDSDVDGEGVAPRFLSTVVQRESIRWKEREMREPSSPFMSVEMDGSRTDHVEVVDHRMDHRAHMGHIWDTVASYMTEDQQRAFVMKSMGYTRKETAERMGATELEIKALYRTGLYAAKKAMATLGINPDHLFREQAPKTAPEPAQDPVEAPEEAEQPTAATRGAIPVERHSGRDYTIMGARIGTTWHPAARIRPTLQRNGAWWKTATEKEFQLLQ